MVKRHRPEASVEEVEEVEQVELVEQAADKSLLIPRSVTRQSLRRLDHNSVGHKPCMKCVVLVDVAKPQIDVLSLFPISTQDKRDKVQDVGSDDGDNTYCVARLSGNQVETTLCLLPYAAFPRL